MDRNLVPVNKALTRTSEKGLAIRRTTNRDLLAIEEVVNDAARDLLTVQQLRQETVHVPALDPIEGGITDGLLSRAANNIPHIVDKRLKRTTRRGKS